MFVQALLLTIAAIAPLAHSQDVCSLPVVVGPCRALIPRFAYNPDTNTCELFNYGGCAGNDNNFVTLEECEAACAEEFVCLLPVVVGPCDALIPRFAYNPVTSTCEPFNYGGCEGNGNNFVTLEECVDECL